MHSILVTGSEGFIGKRLVERLNSLGHKLLTFDKKPGKNNHIQGDLLDFDFSQVMHEFRPDRVIHLAAQIVVTDSFEIAEKDLLVNTLGTLKLVTNALSQPNTEFIYIHSGGAVYDSNSPMPLTEASNNRPVSPYGVSKQAGEDYVRVLFEHKRRNWSSLALSNCYGPVEEQQKAVIYEISKCLLEGKRPKIFGPDVTRDLVYVDDVVNAILLTLDKATNSRVNISAGIEVTLSELVINIQKVLGTDISPEIFPPRDGEVLRSCLSNKKAKEVLDWEPKFNLNTGLAEALALVPKK
jgi:UDP-glucose 4-epimerase